MSVSPAQLIQLTCPNCRSPVRAQVVTFVDVGQFPQLKGPLLAGQLNIAVCQNCGTPVMISAPLIYHDPAKQLFLTFFPQQLSASPDEQERFIGDATSLIMRSLPQDAPRGYLFAPKRFLTLNSLVEAVLEADGISKEEIEAQRNRIELISRLAEAFESGDEALTVLVEQERDRLDYDFFSTLTAFVEASAQASSAEDSSLLANLRARLLELTGMEDTLGDGLGDDDYDLDEVITRLTEADDDEIEPLIGELRPAIDYSFFEEWTRRIDAAEQAGDEALAARLTSRRTLVRETVERMDRQAQEMFERGAIVLTALLEAPDLEAAVRERVDEIDEAFLLVVETHIAAAERAGRADMAQRLSEIYQRASDVIEERLSPEDRFINALLNTETPQEATRLLRQNPATITPAFVKRLNELADQSEQAGRKPLGERLRQLAREAGAMLF